MAQVNNKGGKADGWPARLYRSLALSGVMPILGRKRNLRGDNLDEEQMDMLAIDEQGRVKTAPQTRQEQLLEEISAKLTDIHETLMERLE